MSSRGGRGRGISNQPAWMTRGESGGEASTRSAPSTGGSGTGNGGGHSSGPSHGPGYNHGSSSHIRHDAPRDRYDRRRDDRGPPRGGGYRDRRGGYGQPPHRGHGHRGPPPRAPRRGIFFKSYEEERAWVEERRIKRVERKSLFDVEPTAEQVALDELQKAALASHGPNPNVFLKPEERVGAMISGVSSSLQPQQTRHARRLYIGQLSPDLSERDVNNFFAESIATAMGADAATTTGVGDDPILSVYINKERHFAFVEFKSMDVTTACLSLNGVNMMNRGKIIIKRPNDYNPANAPAATQDFMRKFDVSKLGIISQIVADSPHKIFIGGLPYHLNDEQVTELLSAFGKLKAFHLVKNDIHAVTSKGYCFVEYADESVTEVAIMGLNGMDMGGGKVLSAKIASKRRDGEGAEIGTAAIAGAMAVTPIVPSGDMIASGGVSAAPPVMKYVDNIDVEALVDVAMGTANGSSIAVGNGVGNDAAALAPPPTNALDIANAALQAIYGSSEPTSTTSGNGSTGKTRIVVLENMVTDEDFATTEDFEGLKEEVKEECEKFGSLISMVVPHPKDDFSPTALKKIFLEYATLVDATNAQRELAGRQFGISVVKVSFFDEQDFSSRKLR